MLDTIPAPEELTALVGKSLYDVWSRLCASIDEKYDMERQWNKGGKAWTYEYKYRRCCPGEPKLVLCKSSHSVLYCHNTPENERS